MKFSSEDAKSPLLYGPENSVATLTAIQPYKSIISNEILVFSMTLWKLEATLVCI